MKLIRLLCAIASLGIANAVYAGPVPSSARIDFTASHITATAVTGEADRRTQRPLSIDDPVRIASISKLEVALAVLKLVERGKVSLDRDVSDYLGWPLRNPSFPDTPITLQLLLSHQSSLTDDADYLIPVDQTVRAKLADPKAWDRAHKPGTWFRYTNLNFPVIAGVLEVASGERFDRLVEQTVLKPLKLDACYNWSGCSPGRVGRAVVLYDERGGVRRDDLKGAAPACPGGAAKDGGCDLTAYQLGWNGAIFSPQGGLRISARDLSKIGQMLLRRGKGFLKPSSFAQLMTPLWRYDGTNGDSEKGFFCSYGLAVHFIGSERGSCNDDLFGDGRARFGHSGEAYGLKSGLWLDPLSGKGIVFFTTAVPDDAPRGRSAFYAVEEALLQDPSHPADK
jgi:CubicO group peptidase (beta-lactamase class C family)